jgi:hypothetical protein
MKPDVGMGLSVRFQHFGGRVPYPFHEHIQGTGFQGKRDFIIHRKPYPCFINNCRCFSSPTRMSAG